MAPVSSDGAFIRKELHNVLAVVKSARFPILIAAAISGWIAITDSIVRRCFSYIFIGLMANLLNLAAYSYAKSKFTPDERTRMQLEKIFRHWEVATGAIYIVLCEYVFDWHSPVDRDTFCFHLPTFYGVVVAEDLREAIIYLTLHGILIAPTFFGVHYIMGYLQHCCMLAAAAHMKYVLAGIASKSLALLDEHDRLQEGYHTQADKHRVQETALKKKTKEYEEMSRMAEEAVSLLSQRGRSSF